MTKNACVGTSCNTFSMEAGREAARMSLKELGGREPQLSIVFATAGYDQEELMQGVKEVLGDTPICGCSGEGVITQEGSDEGSHSVSVMSMCCEGMWVNPMQIRNFSKDPVQCGVNLANQIRDCKQKDGKLLMLYIDGVTGNSTEFVASLQKHLPYPLMVVGGAAGSIMDKIDKTYQYYNGEVFTDSICAFLLGGNIEPDIVVSHGCQPIGVEMTVTKSNGPMVEEIDGRPAWEVFKEYLDGDPDDLFVEDLVHLCIGEQLPTDERDNGKKQHIIRTPVRLDASKKALFVPGQLKTGAKIMMTRRDPHKIAENAVSYASEMKNRHHNEEPMAMLQFDCAWRGRILFGDKITGEVISPVQKVFGKSVPWTGFHTFGEIAPIGDEAYFHNVTVALCALYPGKN